MTEATVKRCVVFTAKTKVSARRDLYKCLFNLFHCAVRFIVPEHTSFFSPFRKSGQFLVVKLRAGLYLSVGMVDDTGMLILALCAFFNEGVVEIKFLGKHALFSLCLSCGLV